MCVHVDFVFVKLKTKELAFINVRLTEAETFSVTIIYICAQILQSKHQGNSQEPGSQTARRMKQTDSRINFLLLTHSIRNACNKDMFPRVDSPNTSQLSFPSSLTKFKK